LTNEQRDCVGSCNCVITKKQVKGSTFDQSFYLICCIPKPFGTWNLTNHGFGDFGKNLIPYRVLTPINDDDLEVLVVLVA